jgi:hypothetical protein
MMKYHYLIIDSLKKTRLIEGSEFVRTETPFIDSSANSLSGHPVKLITGQNRVGLI